MYAELEPIGPPAEFWRAGLIASTVMNVNRTKKSQSVVTPEDCMPKSFTDEPEPLLPDELGKQVAQVFHGMAELSRARALRSA